MPLTWGEDKSFCIVSPSPNRRVVIWGSCVLVLVSGAVSVDGVPFSEADCFIPVLSPFEKVVLVELLDENAVSCALPRETVNSDHSSMFGSITGLTAVFQLASALKKSFANKATFLYVPVRTLHSLLFRSWSAQSTGICEMTDQSPGRLPDAQIARVATLLGWRECISGIAASYKDKMQRIVVTGSRSSGTTSFVVALANMLANHAQHAGAGVHRHVILLDTDPSDQLVAPACHLSATILSSGQYISGYTYCGYSFDAGSTEIGRNPASNKRRNAVRTLSQYYGYLSPRDNMPFYTHILRILLVSALTYVADCCTDQIDGCPSNRSVHTSTHRREQSASLDILLASLRNSPVFIVVNTPSWNQGIGDDVLDAILRLLGPPLDHIVELTTPTSIAICNQSCAQSTLVYDNLNVAGRKPRPEKHNTECTSLHLLQSFSDTDSTRNAAAHKTMQLLYGLLGVGRKEQLSPWRHVQPSSVANDRVLDGFISSIRLKGLTIIHPDDITVVGQRVLVPCLHDIGVSEGVAVRFSETLSKPFDRLQARPDVHRHIVRLISCSIVAMFTIEICDNGMALASYHGIGFVSSFRDCEAAITESSTARVMAGKLLEEGYCINCMCLSFQGSLSLPSDVRGSDVGCFMDYAGGKQEVGGRTAGGRGGGITRK